MIIKQILFFILLLSFITSWSNSKGPGSTSGTTLLQPISPKAAAMAGACSSLSGEIMLIGYNPAGLANIRNFEISIMNQKGFADDNMTVLLIGKKLLNTVFTAAVIYYNTGKISIFDATGSPVKKTGQQDVVIIFGTAGIFKKISGGFNLKFITSEIFDTSAFAFAVDLGGQYSLSEEFNLGLVLQNIGTKLTYIDKEEDLPTNIRASITWKKPLTYRDFTISLELPYFVYDNELFILIGSEVTFDDRISIRMGYKTSADSVNRVPDKLNIGWGIKIGVFKFDHSITLTDKLQIPQRISIGFIF